MGLQLTDCETYCTGEGADPALSWNVNSRSVATNSLRKKKNVWEQCLGGLCWIPDSGRSQVRMQHAVSRTDVHSGSVVPWKWSHISEVHHHISPSGTLRCWEPLVPAHSEKLDWVVITCTEAKMSRSDESVLVWHSLMIETHVCSCRCFGLLILNIKRNKNMSSH